MLMTLSKFGSQKHWQEMRKLSWGVLGYARDCFERWKFDDWK